MSKGYVYILSDTTHPYLKIGRTTRIPEQRVRELNTTGMPGKLGLLDSILVNDCEMVEAEIHRTLAKYRVRSDREFFDVPQAVATAYLQTFSKYSKAESLVTQEREEIERYISDIGLFSISLFASKLVELLNDILNKHQQEFPIAVRTAGPVLYESFRSSTSILAEHSNTIVAISFNDDNIDAWSIGVGEYSFIFDGNKADAKLIQDFQEEGKRVLGLFAEMERLNRLIESATVSDNITARISDYSRKAKEIILSASNSHRFCDFDEHTLNNYAFDQAWGVGVGREFLTNMLREREGYLLTEEEKEELDALEKAFKNYTIEQEIQLESSDSKAARLLLKYHKLEHKNSLYVNVRSEIDNYQNQLSALDKIDTLKEEILNPLLISLCELYDLIKQAQDTYLSFIEGIDSLLKRVRLILFFVSIKD